MVRRPGDSWMRTPARLTVRIAKRKGRHFFARHIDHAKNFAFQHHGVCGHGQHLAEVTVAVLHVHLVGTQSGSGGEDENHSGRCEQKPHIHGVRVAHRMVLRKLSQHETRSLRLAGVSVVRESDIDWRIGRRGTGQAEFSRRQRQQNRHDFGFDFSANLQQHFELRSHADAIPLLSARPRSGTKRKTQFSSSF